MLFFVCSKRVALWFVACFVAIALAGIGAHPKGRTPEASFHINFEQREMQLCLLFKGPPTKEIAQEALRKIKESYDEIVQTLKFYNCGEHNYKETILSCLEMIVNNYIPNAEAIPEITQMERASLRAFFAPIREECARLKQTLSTDFAPDEAHESTKQARNKVLLQLMRKEQELLSSSVTFASFLEKLKTHVKAKNPQPASIYFAYAWPKLEMEAEENWVQPFLITFQNHLNKAGIENVKMDVVSNQHGANLYESIEEARTAEYVLLFGTASLKTQRKEGIHKVCAELVNIIRKIEQDFKNGMRRVFPILLDGISNELFPPEYELVSTITDWRQDGYLHNFQKIYLELFSLSPEQHLAFIKRLWEEAVVEQASPREVAHLKKIEEKRQQVKTSPPNIPGFVSNPSKPVNNLPRPPQFACPGFQGRQQEFRELHRLLQTNDRVILTGLRGVGKTALVVQYATEHANEYEFVHYVRCENPDLFVHDLLQLANERRIPQGSAEDRLEWLKISLEREDSEFLLIFDGVTLPRDLRELSEFFPRRGPGVLLLVSSLQGQEHSKDFAPMLLTSFTKEEAVDYLLRFNSRDSDASKAALVAEKLGYFPLVLAQVAAFIRQTPGQNFTTFLEKLTTNGLEVITNREEKMVSKMWNMSLQAITDELGDSTAKKIMGFLSVLGRASIPTDIMQHWEMTCLSESSRPHFNLALRRLNDFCLIDGAGERVNLHVLVQEVVRSSLDPETRKNCVMQALSVFHDISKNSDARDSRDMERIRLLLPHFETIIKYLENTPSSDIRMLELLDKMWICYMIDGKYKELDRIAKTRLAIGQRFKNSPACAQGHYQAAYTLHLSGNNQAALDQIQKALEMGKRYLGENHVQIVESYILLGMVLRDLGSYEKAYKALVEASNIAKKLEGQDLRLAVIYDQMGTVLQESGRYREAEDYEERALGIFIQNNREKSREAALCYSNLGDTFCKLGQLQKGFDYATKSFDLRQELLGENHPDLAMNWDGMGCILDKQGKYQQALEYKERALKLRENAFGNKHPLVADSHEGIGATLHYLGRYAQALEHKQLSLDLRKKILGNAHPDVFANLCGIGETLRKLGKLKEAQDCYLTILNSIKEDEFCLVIARSYFHLAKVLRELGKYDEALKCAQKALSTQKITLGERHPETICSLEIVGVALRELGRYQEALALCATALQLAEELVDNEHPLIACVCCQYGKTLAELGRYQESKEYLMRALQLRQKALGDEHPDVAITCSHLAELLEKMGQYDEAWKFETRALDIKKGVFADDHHLVGFTYYTMGNILTAQGKFNEALAYHNRGLALRKALGERHPRVAESYHAIGTALWGLGKYAEALDYQKRGLELRKELFGQKDARVGKSCIGVAVNLRDLGRYEKARSYAMQGLECARTSLGEEHPDVASNFHAIGTIFYELGIYDKAHHYFTNALEIREKVLGKEHPHVASSYDGMGNVLRQLGEYQAALEKGEHALKVRKKTLGDTHPSLASSYTNLGDTLVKLGLYKRSLEYETMAWELRKAAFGEYYPAVARNLNSMGRCLGHLGNYEEALKCLYQALRIQTDVLEEKHPDKALIYSSLGVIYRKMSRYEDSKRCFTDALELRQEVFGNRHPEVATSCSDLGCLAHALGKYDEALTYHTEALECRRQIFADQHPDVLSSCHWMGIILYKLGRYEDALEWQIQALERRQEHLGSEHRDVAYSYNDIGDSLQGLGRYQEALELYRSALKICEGKLGLKHPYTARVCDNIGVILGEIGEHEEALIYKKRALEIRKEERGQRHVWTAFSYQSVGTTLEHLGRYDEALSYQQNALEIAMGICEERHPLIAVCYDGLGSVLGKIGKHEECLYYRKKALDLHKDIFGDEHPDVATGLSHVGEALSAQGKHREALGYEMQAMELRKKIFLEKHPSVMMSYASIARTYQDMGLLDDALHYQLLALDLAQRIFGVQSATVVTHCRCVTAILHCLGRLNEAQEYAIQTAHIQDKLQKSNFSISSGGVWDLLKNIKEQRQDAPIQLPTSSPKMPEPNLQSPLEDVKNHTMRYGFTTLSKDNPMIFLTADRDREIAKYFEEGRRLVVVTGPSGSGKTVRVLHFAERSQNYAYQFYFSSANTEDSYKLNKQLDEFTALLRKEIDQGAPSNAEDTKTKVQTFLALLEKISHKKCLLILDNIDLKTFHLFAPQSSNDGLYRIVISHSPDAWAVHKPIEVKGINIEEFDHMFLKFPFEEAYRTQISEEVRALHTFLNQNPLHITVAFSLLHYSRQTIAAFQELCEERSVQEVISSKQNLGISQVADPLYSETLAQMKSCIAKARTTDPNEAVNIECAYDMICLLSCLHHEEIPLSLLKMWLIKNRPDVDSHMCLPVVLKNLQEQGLIKSVRGVDEDTVRCSLHTDFQYRIWRQFGNEQISCYYETLLTLLDEEFPLYSSNNKDDKKAHTLAIHLEKLLVEGKRTFEKFRDHPERLPQDLADSLHQNLPIWAQHYKTTLKLVIKMADYYRYKLSDNKKNAYWLRYGRDLVAYAALRFQLGDTDEEIDMGMWLGEFEAFHNPVDAVEILQKTRNVSRQRGSSKELTCIHMLIYILRSMGHIEQAHQVISDKELAQLERDYVVAPDEGIRKALGWIFHQYGFLLGALELNFDQAIPYLEKGGYYLSKCVESEKTIFACIERAYVYALSGRVTEAFHMMETNIKKLQQMYADRRHYSLVIAQLYQSEVLRQYGVLKKNVAILDRARICVEQALNSPVEEQGSKISYIFKAMGFMHKGAILKDLYLLKRDHCGTDLESAKDALQQSVHWYQLLLHDSPLLKHVEAELQQLRGLTYERARAV